MTRLVFIHGWGFDAGFWDVLRMALPAASHKALDLGFFGAPDLAVEPSEADIVAVTHSYGTQWLLARRPFAWRALVAINGFPRFCEAPGFAPATPPRLLDRMLRRWDADAAGVLDEFRRRCGEPAPLPGTPDPARLKQGLTELRDGDGRDGLTAAFPMLVLAGRTDPIVPPAMTEQAFAARPDTEIAWHDGAGHLLPLADPAWCARRIGAFLDRLVPTLS